MPSKITKVLVEPSKIFEGSTFVLKIKAIRSVTYQEIKDNLTYATLENYTFNQLKGE